MMEFKHSNLVLAKAEAFALRMVKLYKHLQQQNETLYWLNLLVKSDCLPNDAATQSLIADCDEILRLLVSSIKTARANNSAIPNSSF